MFSVYNRYPWELYRTFINKFVEEAWAVTAQYSRSNTGHSTVGALY